MSHPRRTALAGGLLGGLLALGATAGAGEPVKPGDELFERPTLVEVSLALTPEAAESLRKAPRDWVQAQVILAGKTVSEVAVHLKGTTSFMPLEQKPSFTLNFSKHAPGRSVAGLRKMHLNNSAQDSSYACEFLAGELFRRAGVPCARVAWARVRLNSRDLGLYVLKEGVTDEFLRRYFPEAKGNLYDGGVHRDVFDALELESGKGPRDHSDLKSVLAASRQADPELRWQELSRVVDLERFAAMLAMEVLTCHVDGYSFMQNNYLIYFEPSSRKAVFLAHGLDRMFEPPDFALEPTVRGTVARALLETPQGRRLYQERLAGLSRELFQPEWLTNRLEAVIRLLEPANDVAARDARLLRERVLKRVEFVRRELPGGARPVEPAR